ncbi:MAG: hypothetical protein ACRENP_14120 [Longimicrobiales bacterium]
MKASQKAVLTKLPTGPQAVADAGHVLLVALRQFDVHHDKANFSHFEPHRWFDGVLLALDRKSGGILAAHVFDEFILASPIAEGPFCMTPMRRVGHASN